MLILPAIDLRGGRCVRLRQGDFRRETVFDADPADVARRFGETFEACGIPPGERWLHVVDLDGARTGSPVHGEAVRGIVEASGGAKVELGGGIRTGRAVKEAIDSGAARVVVGTRAVRDPEWFERLVRDRPGCVVLGLDARQARVAVAGWSEATGKTAAEIVKAAEGLPLAAVVYTDIDRDGMMEGPNVAATRRVVEATRLAVIASGGVTTGQDVAALRRAGCAGAVVGRALYEGRLTLEAALAAAREEQVGGTDA